MLIGKCGVYNLQKTWQEAKNKRKQNTTKTNDFFKVGSKS